MSIAKYAAAFAVIILVAYPAQGQEPVREPQAESAQPTPRLATPATMSKSDLAIRFQHIKGQYASIKDATGRYLPLKQTDSVELKQARLQLSSAIRAYEFHEGQTQIQRDKLNQLTALTEAD